jgi:hypothetical protein
VVGSGIALFPGNSAMVVLGVTGVEVLSAFDCQYTSQAPCGQTPFANSTTNEYCGAKIHFLSYLLSVRAAGSLSRRTVGR